MDDDKRDATGPALPALLSTGSPNERKMAYSFVRVSLKKRSIMASGVKNPRLGTYIIKKFGDGSFRAFCAAASAAGPAGQALRAAMIVGEAQPGLGPP
jgi:hypothetical protein